MNATLIVSLILGAGGALSGLYTLIEKVRNHETEKQKQEGDIQLTDEQSKKIAKDAASITIQDNIRLETWWKEQFDAVKDELRETKEELKETKIELKKSRTDQDTTQNELDIQRRWHRTVSRYIRRHQPWDDQVVEVARQHNWPIDPPPKLDFDEGFTEEDVDE